jgi:hypothetical protein
MMKFSDLKSYSYCTRNENQMHEIELNFYPTLWQRLFKKEGKTVRYVSTTGLAYSWRNKNTFEESSWDEERLIDQVLFAIRHSGKFHDITGMIRTGKWVTMEQFGVKR